MNGEHICPVCEKHTFTAVNSYDYCPVCDWQDDAVQNADHDYTGGANSWSVNQAKADWQKRQAVKTA